MLTAKSLTGELYHHTQGDVDSLHRLAHMLPDNPVVVNIGACFGTSALAMLEARPDAYIFSIDVKECPLEAGYIRQSGLDARRVVRVLGASQTVLRFWPDQSVDMVFVDGAHDYASVCEDARQAMRILKPGGIVAFHDYGTPSLPTVVRAIDDSMTGEAVLHVERIKAWQV